MRSLLRITAVYGKGRPTSGVGTRSLRSLWKCMSLTWWSGRRNVTLLTTWRDTLSSTDCVQKYARTCCNRRRQLRTRWSRRRRRWPRRCSRRYVALRRAQRPPSENNVDSFRRHLTATVQRRVIVVCAFKTCAAPTSAYTAPVHPSPYSHAVRCHADHRALGPHLRTQTARPTSLREIW